MKAKTLTTYFIFLTGVFLSGYFGPWWAPAAFVVVVSILMQLTSKKAAMAGGVSTGITYLAMALWLNSVDKADIIGKTGSLLGGLSSLGLIVITVLIGIVTGALAGWLGSALSGVLQKNEAAN